MKAVLFVEAVTSTWWIVALLSTLGKTVVHAPSAPWVAQEWRGCPSQHPGQLAECDFPFGGVYDRLACWIAFGP